MNKSPKSAHTVAAGLCLGLVGAVMAEEGDKQYSPDAKHLGLPLPKGEPTSIQGRA